MSADIQLVVFDIAGTLIEDRNEVADSFLAALHQHGLNATPDEITEIKGSAKREVIAQFVHRQFGTCGTRVLIDQTYAHFRWLLEKRYTDGGVVPIAGANETFRFLRQQGIMLATTTGFYREVRDAVLKAAAWESTFDANVCSDDVPNGRPAPDMIIRAMAMTGVSDPKRVLNIGDTPLDLQAGTNAGCGMVIGVLTGTHKEDRLRQEAHTRLIASVADIPGIFGGNGR
jgi:phosphonatase-like hydrolase